MVMLYVKCPNPNPKPKVNQILEGFVEKSIISTVFALLSDNFNTV